MFGEKKKWVLLSLAFLFFSQISFAEEIVSPLRKKIETAKKEYDSKLVRDFRKKAFDRELIIVSIEITGFPNKGMWSIYCGESLLDSFSGYRLYQPELLFSVRSEESANIIIHRNDEPYESLKIPYSEWIQKSGNYSLTESCDLGDGESLTYTIRGKVR